MIKTKKFLITVGFIIVCFFMSLVVLFGTGSSIYASAATADRELTLHEQTKIYSSLNSEDYYYGCEDNSTYKYHTPEITVLTHGFDSKGSYWSNDISVENGKVLAYNSSSLIEKMHKESPVDLLVYFAECKSDKSFNLTQLSRDMQIIKETDRLDDVSNKHIILIFQSNIPLESNDDVYEEFENLLDNISMQYKSLTGFLPRFNLVGHSRGGLTNIMYAIEHPYNIASIFSLGTPYNGSVLGKIDAVLKMFNYYNKDTDTYVGGVESILDDDESVRIRDAWNKVYNITDVDIHAVAYGSMTSIPYISAMLNDAVNGGSKYGNMIAPYLNLLKTVLNFADNHPDLTGVGLDFFGGLAEVLNIFGVNLYDRFFTSLSEELEGSVTIEEGRKILSLYNVINDQAVIMDDLFIDLNSQLGYNFNDGVDYNGFKRYVKIFDVQDLTPNRAIPDLPAIVHNMETMNETYTNDISAVLSYGIQTTDIEKLQDDTQTSLTFVGEKAYIFNSDATGERKITADGANIEIYKFNSNNGLKLEESSSNNLIYEFKNNQKYLIIVSKNTDGRIDISFDLTERFYLGESKITLSPNDKRKFKITVHVTGYYLVSSSNDSLTISWLTDDPEGKKYVYLLAESENYIYLTNSTSHEATSNISITTPQEISPDVGEFTINFNQQVLRFTNPYNQSVQFILEIKFETSISSDAAKIYDQSNTPIATTGLGGNSIDYYFGLESKQSCYIVFSDDGYNSNKANLYINPNQLSWRIDNNNITTNKIQLPRGATYQIDLVLTSSGQQINYNSRLLFDNKNDYFTIKTDISGNILTIYNSALIGYDIVLTHSLYPENQLYITIGFNNEFSYSVINSDSIVLNWNTTLYNEALQEITVNIEYPNLTIVLKLYSPNGSMDITTYIPDTGGTTTISIVTIKISGIMYYNNSDFLNVPDTRINNLYGDGSGYLKTPYTITCYRHLYNIRKYPSLYYLLTANIDMNDKGDWIPIPNFSGNINGNGYSIINMKVNVSGERSQFGFIEYNTGTLKDLKFIFAEIFTKDLNVSTDVSVGVIVGYNKGYINNCRVNDATIDVQIYKSNVGGIVGYNDNIIYDSILYYSTMKVSGNAGGIVGVNEAKVELSVSVYVNITYYWKTGNRNVGGVVGYNKSNGIVINCYYEGHIEWSSPNNNRDILPCLGYVIGRNDGEYTDCDNSGSNSIYYYYWHFFIGWYDQSDRCFKSDSGNIGYNG